MLFPDPLSAFPPNDFPFGEVYSGLVRISDGLDGTVESDLASSWEVSGDGLRYRFTLREGLRFSDGSELTARDVKWSWERALSSEYATARSREVFGAVVGSAEMLSGIAEEVSGLRIVDDSTLMVELERPQFHFLAMLADPVASVLSQANVENWGTVNWVRRGYGDLFQESGDVSFRELPVGSGPFRIVDFDHDRVSVRLEPNPHSWRTLPEVSAVWFGQFFRTGGLGEMIPSGFDDADVVSWGADHREIDEVELDFGGASSSLYFVHSGLTSPRVSFMALNTALAPYDDLEFRRALMRASSRDWDSGGALVEKPADPAARLIPPGFAGHGGNVGDYHRDEASAKVHFENSGYSAAVSSLSLEFVSDGSAPDPGGGEFFASFARYWRDWLGLRFDQRHGYDLEDGGYLELVRGGTLQMRYVSVDPAYPDPCAILCRIPELSGSNAQSAETDELREMLYEAAATADRAARIDRYRDIEQHVLDRALVIPVFWDEGGVNWLVKPYISGFKVPAYGGSMYEDVVVDTAHPEYPAGR